MAISAAKILTNFIFMPNAETIKYAMAKYKRTFIISFFMMNSDISFIGAAAEIKDKICHVFSRLVSRSIQGSIW